MTDELLQQLEQMNAGPLPEGFCEFYREVKLACDRVDGGQYAPREMAVMLVTYKRLCQCEPPKELESGENAVDPPEPSDDGETVESSVDWEKVEPNAPILVDFDGDSRPGKFLAVEPKGTIRVKLENDDKQWRRIEPHEAVLIEIE